MRLKYKISKNNLHIEDSYAAPKARFNGFFAQAKALNPGSLVWKRSFRSLGREWAVHNFLYSLGLFRSRTKCVDLEYPQKWYAKFAYTLAGNLVWPIVR